MNQRTLSFQGRQGALYRQTGNEAPAGTTSAEPDRSMRALPLLLALLLARGAPSPRAIIQTGAPHTGSTLLANIVQGLVDAARPVEHGMYLDHAARPTARALVPGVVFKFHNTSAAFMDAHLRAGRFVFVSRRARHATVDAARYERHPAVCVVDYEALTASGGVAGEVDHVLARLGERLPGLKANRSRAIARVAAMNALYERVKHRPFTWSEPMYLIHGHHRDRGPSWAAPGPTRHLRSTRRRPSRGSFPRPRLRSGTEEP